MVAVGGDGIVHHVAQSLIGTDTVLGIIPAGTANVLARILGIPSKPSTAAKVLATGSEPTWCPVVEVEGTTPSSEFRRWSLFSLGAGPDAAVVERAEVEPYRKYRFGSVYYARTALGTVWSDIRRRKPTATVTVGDETLQAIGFLAQFHPAYTYFGRVPLRLGPNLPDPMSVLAVRELPMRRAAAVVRGATSAAGLGGVKGMMLREHVREFGFSSLQPIQVQADGELLGSVTELRAVHQPARLRVARPQSPR